MLELARGVGLGVDVGDLLELERALEAQGVVEIPADVEHGVVIEIDGRVVLDLLAVGEHALHLLRQGLGLRDQAVVFRLRDRAAHAGEVDAEQVQHHQLGGVRLRRGHGDLGTGPGVEHVVGFAGDGAAHHVHDGQNPRSARFGFAQRRHGVERLARLADDDGERRPVHDGVAVAEFGRERHLHGDARELFQVVFADHTDVIRRAARDDRELLKVPQLLVRDLQTLKDDPAVLQARTDGAAHGLRLLHDLLEHKVRIAALLRGGDLPVDVVVLLDDGQLHCVEHGDAAARQNGDLAVLHVADVARVLDERGHVGGDEAAAVAVAQQQRRVLSCGVDAVGRVGAEDAERVRALDAVQYHVQSAQHRAGLLEIIFEQLRHDLAVGLGGEAHALFLEKAADFQIIFDDAVVDKGDFAVLAQMRVGIDVVRLAVGRPAGMADAGRAGERFAAVGHVEQVLQPALGLRHLQDPVRRDADAGGVIAPVFEPGQPVEQNGGGLFAADVAYDSTHRKSSSNIFILQDKLADIRLDPCSQPLCFAVARIFLTV